jgi:carboxyl-terminal processing protease
MTLFTQSPSRLQAALFGGALATTATLTFLVPGFNRAVSAALKDSPKTMLDEAWQIVYRDYVDGTFNRTNWLEVRQQLLNRNYSSREQAYTALRNALEKLQDPYTRFMDPKQFEALTNQTSGELSGVGLRLEVNEKTKVLTVLEPIENSPAVQAGIKSGDRLLAIDGKPTFGMTIEEASNLIRGNVGTEVRLRLMRDNGQELNLKITRARIELPTVKYTLNEDENRRIGYIRLSEFSSHAAEQMQKAIVDLKSKRVQAFVLDLRGNPGGLLQASIEISRMWMNSGVIVKTVDREGKADEERNDQSALTDLPMAVLVDGNSASSSEILTGALQDNKRATVIGSQTFGKALVQSVHQLSDGSGLAVTIAHYYTPRGTDISHKGITPDIPLELSDAGRRKLSADPKLIGTKADPQYARAVQALEASIAARSVINTSAK